MSDKRIAARAAEIIARSSSLPRIQALSDKERVAWEAQAYRQAESEITHGDAQQERQRQRLAEATRIEQLAREIDVEPGVVRRAEAERRRADREAARQRDMDRARAAVGVVQSPAPRPEQTRPGPKQATTREAVEQARSSLAADGLPSGEQAIAELLGVSRSAVRYALGKDRR